MKSTLTLVTHQITPKSEMSQTKISKFFSKRPRIEDSLDDETESSEFRNLNSIPDSTQLSNLIQSNSKELTQCSSSSVTNKPVSILDVGKYYPNSPPEETWKDILLDKSVPDDSFCFPPNSSQRRFQAAWLRNFRWLIYSEKLDAAFCRYCLIFATKNSVGATGKQATGKLVQKPHFDWKHAKDNFKEHEQANYHLESVKAAENFLSITCKGKMTIAEELDSSVREQNKRAKVILVPVIETLIFCGHQNIALRGHADHGKITVETPSINDGNFRELLRMRIKSGDEKLRKYFESAALNATYCSPLIQNELLQRIGSQIQSALVGRVNASKCFSIIADETADVSGVEQLSICVRYIEKLDSKHIVHEDFLTFAPLVGGSAEIIAQKIICELNSLKVDLKNLYGQGYDGCSTMKGHINGVQALIKRMTSSKALFLHCSSHSLNLALADSCGIPDIRNALQTANEVINFFRRSPKRMDALRATIMETYPDSSSRCKLISFCETRFVERHSSIFRFVELFDAIVSCLEKLETQPDRETSSKAHQLVTSISSSRFIVGILILEQILSHTINLSRQLQNPQLDMVSALKMIENVSTRLEALRNNCELSFSSVFAKAESIAEMHGVEITKPRINKRQKYRNNVIADSAEEYYRTAFYISFIDSVIISLKSRFLDHKSTLSGLQSLIPYFIDQKDSECNALLEIYGEDLSDSKVVIENEILMWKEKWTKIDKIKRPDNALTALDSCDSTFFPSVNKLLKILATLPVTTCTAERSFSTLKRLKTYLRSTMGEVRMNGLALLSVYRDIDVDVSAVINEFMCSKKRRISN